MIRILSPAAAHVLEEIARTRTLLAFDFDGTLAPIVPDRGAAAMRSSTGALLRTVALLYPCAVVSGRTRSDVASRVRDVPLVAMIGNHGAEPGFGPVDGRIATRVAAWRPHLEAAVGATEGLELEDKRFSIALHYRNARSWTDAEGVIARTVEKLDGARVFHGHAVVNVVPEEASTKGDALRALCDRLGSRVAVYVGDDRTDEDAFQSEVVSISIRVGDSPDSSARYCLGSQEELDELLRALITARATLDGRGHGWQGLVRALER
jgi:trehalose 6-phosphate phosphatase